MSKGSVIVAAPFKPLEILKQKPIPVTLDQLHEYTGTEVDGLSLFKILENQVDQNSGSVKRDIILDRLQSNGFLVQSCHPSLLTSTIHVDKKKSIASLLGSDDDEEEDEEPNDQKNYSDKGRKIENVHVQLEDAAEKGLTKETDEEDDDDERENLADKDKVIQVPGEPKYDETAVINMKIDIHTIFILCSEKEEEKPPGKEPSESIPKERISEFAALAKIPKWRQSLCNTFDSPFTLDEKKWQNVNHFLIAAQYRKYSVQQAFEQYEEAVKINNNNKIKVDDEYEQRAKKEMFHALYAKFTQNPELARILEATKDAQLFYRVNKQKKVEFTELMWLRELLRDFVRSSLKPLAEEPLAPKLRKRAIKEGKEYDLSEVSVGQYAPQMPKYIPDVVKSSGYYMNNRTQFIQKINELYRKYGAETDDSSGKFDLLTHQKVVRDYLDIVTPYRGLLVYHNLGTGKSCTSIAVTEGMKQNKRIIIMVPAALRTNYEFELKKCGDLIYRNNQHWEFVSIVGKPELLPVLAKALTMSPKEVDENKGAWMVNINKPANFKNLNPDDQKKVRDQIQHMISQKYTFLHYNANNLGKKVAELSKTTKNPFDHTTMVIDEAHNFISNIVGNLKSKNKDSIYLKLYDMLMDATNFKIVMLSGTPIINYPHEMAVMFNILRGYIYTWTFKIQVNTSEKVTTDYIRNILDKHNCNVYDFIEYTRNTLIITRNPYGFVNVNNDPHTNNNNNNNNTSQKAFKTPHHNATNKNKQSGNKQSGGYGIYGVRLDEKGNIDNDTFKKQIVHILKDYDLIVDGNPKVEKEKCLPDDEKKFRSIFLNETTNYSDKNNTSSDLQHIQTLRRRILGLTSYFRSPNESMLPEFVLNAENTPFHEVRVPMSDYQFGNYAKVRKVELDKEKKAKTMRGMQKDVNNGELFQMASSYRVFSRTVCNFAFPVPPGRPLPKYKPGKEEDEDDADGSSKDKEDDIVVNDNDGEYERQIESAMSFLKENRSKLLIPHALSQYSPKMLEILKNIKNPKHKGLHLLYSNFVTMEGIGIFQEVLNANGFQEFKIKKESGNWVLDYTHDERMCYALYTGKEDSEVREIMRNVFNGEWENVPDTIALDLRKIKENNMYGEIVKIFMITAAGAEGINLKNTRYVHIMEPYWHNVRLEQVIGRARRINSHMALPLELRTVQVFLYLSVMSDEHKKDDKFKEIQINDLSKIKENTPVTTDEYLYEISQMKQKINNQFLRVIKETAMDCQLYVQKHNKHEPLVCYGRGFAPDRTFASYPSQKMDLQEDMNKQDNIAKPVITIVPLKTKVIKVINPKKGKVLLEKEPDEVIVMEPEKEKKTQDNIMVEAEDLQNAKGEKLNYTSPAFIKGIPILAKTMYNDKVVFLFYSKSNDKPYPGKGVGEELPASLKEEYAELNKITGWRKMLSNFWIQPFELRGKKWNSVEHYYQASKFRIGNPKFYDKFSLDSKSAICENPAIAKSAGGKTGKYDGVLIRPKEVKIDADFFGSNRSNEEMYLAQYAKFTNKEALRLGEDTPYLSEMLLHTKDAKLLHTVSRSTEKVVFENLMIIRDLLKSGKI
jgi:predicted NAD-dependent protein-ADP-ribosyltransferase YbiA (DUF1768 family)